MLCLFIEKDFMSKGIKEKKDKKKNRKDKNYDISEKY